MMGFSCFLHDLSFISIDQAAQLCNRIGLPVPKISLMLCPVCIARTDAMPAAVAYGTNRTDPKGTPHPTMGDGTPAMGKRHKKTHALCPRCGKRSYHTQKTAFHGSWRAGIRNKFSINLWSCERVSAGNRFLFKLKDAERFFVWTLKKLQVGRPPCRRHCLNMIEWYRISHDCALWLALPFISAGSNAPPAASQRPRFDPTTGPRSPSADEHQALAAWGAAGVLSSRAKPSKHAHTHIYIR